MLKKLPDNWRWQSVSTGELLEVSVFHDAESGLLVELAFQLSPQVFNPWQLDLSR